MRKGISKRNGIVAVGVRPRARGAAKLAYSSATSAPVTINRQTETSLLIERRRGDVRVLLVSAPALHVAHAKRQAGAGAVLDVLVRSAAQ